MIGRKFLRLTVSAVFLVLLITGQAFADVAIDETNFPDEEFRSYVYAHLNFDGDSVLNSYEIESCTRIDVSGKGISSLKGIEFFPKLKELWCQGNKLTQLNFNENAALADLYCQNNQLTSLGVSKNTALSKLYCQNNRMKSLDVSKNAVLSELNCSYNCLTELNVSNNIHLSGFENYEQSLEGVKYTYDSGVYSVNLKDYVSDISKIQADTVVGKKGNIISTNYDSGTGIATFTEKPDTVHYEYDTGYVNGYATRYMEVTLTLNTKIAIDETNFPDEKFRQYVKDNFDKNGDEILDDLEISDVKKIMLYTKSIRNFKGIEFFTALETLDCEWNYAQVELDLSNNIALKELECGGNLWTQLDLSKNTALVSLDCSSSQFLAKLDISNSTNLAWLDCSDCQLKELDLSDKEALYHLECDRNQLKSLDLSRNTALKYLACEKNLLTQLDVSNNRGLTVFDCSDNQLTELDVSNNTALFNLDCSKNQLGRLDLSKNESLSRLYCNNNKLTELDLSKNIALTRLYCSDNQLKQLYLDKNVNLREVSCGSQHPENFEYTYVDGFYCVNLKEYLGENFSKIDPDSVRGQYSTGEYDKATGVAKFSGRPGYVFYKYKTGYQSSYMDVYTHLEDRPTIISFDIPAAGMAGEGYAGKVIAEGCSSYTWEKSSGDLPTGLELSDTTKDQVILSGIPTEAGEFTFVLKVTNENGNFDTKEFTVTIVEAMSISGDLTASGVIKNPYSSALKVSGGISPYIWAVSDGILPDGLELSPDLTGKNLVVKGIPTTAKTYSFTLTVTDKNEVAISKQFKIKITKPSIKGSLTNSGIVKKSYSSYITVSGGITPYKWTKTSGTLPAGLKLVSNDTGTKLTLEGTPTTAKTYTFKLRATDKNGATASKSFTVTITKPTISGSLNANGIVKESYSSYITVSGGTEPYKWTKTSGTLPAGLKLVSNDTGTKLTLEGTPKTAKTYTFKLRATDKNGATASKSFTITIKKTATTQNESKDGYSEEDISNVEGFEGVDGEAIVIFEAELEDDTDKIHGGLRHLDLKVISDDILWQGTGKDEDLIGVLENQPVNFVVLEWNESNDAEVFIDENLMSEIEISDEGNFTLPADFVSNDFKVQVKSDKFETDELFISVEK